MHSRLRSCKLAHTYPTCHARAGTTITPQFLRSFPIARDEPRQHLFRLLPRHARADAPHTTAHVALTLNPPPHPSQHRANTSKPTRDRCWPNRPPRSSNRSHRLQGAGECDSSHLDRAWPNPHGEGAPAASCCRGRRPRLAASWARRRGWSDDRSFRHGSPRRPLRLLRHHRLR